MQMNKLADDLRSQIINDFSDLEPGESDSWNPVSNEFELGYRLSLFYAATKCMELCEIPIKDLKFLDLGSGNGRSTRMYIDLGLRPEQLTAVDLRPNSIALAKSLHPAINYAVYDGERTEFEDSTFNWIQAATVFTSIADKDHRRHVANEIMRLLAPGGYVFYFDLWRANYFAGKDVIKVAELFPDCELVWDSPLRAHQCLPRVRGKWKLIKHGRSRVEQLRRILQPRTRIKRILEPSHRVSFFRKPL